MKQLSLPASGTSNDDKVSVLSAEVFIIPMDKERYIVYAPLRRAAFVGNARMVNLIADLQAGRFDPHQDPDGALRSFLRRLQIIDAGPEPLPITTFTGSPEPVAVTLFLTTACNLRCSYCYASAGDTPGRYMSLETAKRGIDFIIENAIKRKHPGIEITYHGGGEPTVHWKVMTESLAYAQEKAEETGLTVDAFTMTNGVLTDRQTDWIIANLNSVGVSFDGMPAVQDQHRPTLSGK
jgi:uncharacterized protein